MRGLHDRPKLVFASVILATLAGCGGGDSLTVPPTVGNITLTATTTGVDPDPDGYTISVDGTDRGTLPATGTVTVEDLAPGSHTVGLSGVSGNCLVDGANPRAVTVTAGESASLAFTITCTAPPVGAGTLRIITSTTGAGSDPNGYVFSVDGGTTQPIAVSATVSLTNLVPGSHSVTLSDIAGNCAVQGDNPRAVDLPAGGTADVSFAVTCTAGAAGSIEVTTTTTGANPDPDGYAVSLDGAAQVPIAAAGTHRFEAVASGDHRVELFGIAGNCFVQGENPRTVQVAAESPATVAFAVTCSNATGTSLIAFESNAVGLQAIFVIRPDGTGLQRISPEDVFDEGPVWSPDRQKILFSSDQGLHVMNADGSGRQILAPGEGFHSYRWSRDGGRIVYQVTTDTGEDIFEELWVMQADGSGKLRLAPNASSPSWSPDGSRIAYENEQRIRVIGSDGSGDTPVTPETVSAFQPAWSPDGTQIAFVTLGDNEIFVMNPDGSGAVNLTNGAGSDEGPTWSADGSKLAFNTAPIDQPLESEVAVMNRDGSGRINVTNRPGFDFGPDWSPDGLQLVYQTSDDDDAEIFVVNADGTGQRNLSQRPDTREGSADWSGNGPGVVASHLASANYRRLRTRGASE